VKLLAVTLLSASIVGSAQTARVTDTPVNSVPFLGLGIEFDPYPEPVNDARWQTMLGRVRRADTGFLRVMSSATDYCGGFDSAGNPIYLWKSEPEAPALQRIYDVLDFAQKNGIEVLLGEWSSPGKLGIRSPDDPRWPRMVADFVQHLIRDKHYTVIQFYIMMNEPNGDWMWRRSKPQFDQWSAGVQLLRKELDARNLQSVLLAGPDNSGGREWFNRSIAELHPVYGAWEQHIYAKDSEVLNGELEQQLFADGTTITTLDPEGGAKARFIAESGLVTGKIEELDQQPRVHDFDYGVLMADYVIQVARAGWLGADAWDLDDAMHGNGKGGQKIWGFWDSRSLETMHPRPWFESWSLMSRAMRRGSTVMRVTGDLPASVRATAVKFQSDWSVVIVNDSAAPVSLDFLMPQGISHWYAYRYFENDRKTDVDGFIQNSGTLRTSNGIARIQMPGRGLLILTNKKLGR